MKLLTINRYTILLSFFSAALLFTACKKEQEASSCNGTPVITRVVQPTDRNSIVDAANFREFVTIQGENLCDVVSVTFNDIAVNSDDYYATPTEITVRIPSEVPRQVSDKVFVKTSRGEASATFIVKVPPLTITGVDNEYAPAGSTMMLFGPSFKVYGFTEGKGKVFFGDAEAAITHASADTLLVTVPVGAQQGAVIKAVAENGSIGTYAYPYQDNTNLMFDFDTKPGTSTGFITNSATPGPISGNYVQVKKTIPVWGAQEFIRGTGNLPADVVANPGNYLYKFEVNTQIPFNAQGIRMWVDYGNSGVYYLWNPSVSPFDTKGKWITYSIPVTELVKATTIPSRPNNDYTFRAIVYGPTEFPMDFSMDNVRIVPIK